MRLRPKLIIWSVLLVLVLAGLGALWLFRAPVATSLGNQVMAWMGVDGAFTITALELDHAEIEGLVIGPGEAPGVAAERIEVRYAPLSALVGRISGVRLEGLQVRAVWDESGVSLPGLPRNEGGGGGEPSAPSFAIHAEDARFAVVTTAGEISGEADIVGGPEDGWRAAVALAPASVSRGEAGMQIDSGNFEFTIEDGEATAQAQLEISDLNAPQARAEQASVELNFDGAADNQVRLRGVAGRGQARLSLNGAGLSEAQAQAIADLLNIEIVGPAGDIAGPHLAALRALTAQAAQSFDATLAAQLLLLDGRLQLVLEGPNRVTSAEGAQLIVAPSGDVAAIELDPYENRYAATDLTISLSGGGAPTFEFTIAEALRELDERGGERLSMIGAGRLAPWRVDGFSAGVDLRAARIDMADDNLTAIAVGTLRMDGARADLDTDDVLAEFDLAVGLENGGVAVRIPAEAALSLRADTLAFGAARFSDADLTLRAGAAGGPLVALTGEAMIFDGRIEDSELTIDLEDGAVSVQMPAALLRYEGAPGGEGSITLVAQGPRIGGQTARTGALAGEARIIEGALGLGESITVDVRASTLNLATATLPLALNEVDAEIVLSFIDGAPDDGSVTVARAILCEPGQISARSDAGASCNNARVAPIIVSASADIEDGVASGEAQASIASAGRAATGGGTPLGEANFRINLVEQSGSAQLASERIAFAPGRNGLRPYDLAPSLRTLITDVRGAVRFDANAQFAGDDVDVSARVRIEDLDFATSVGRVEGLNTDFALVDAIALRSDGPQEVRVDLIDPGVPLENGVLRIDLRGDGVAMVEEARFPFSGGEIAMTPMEWNTADEDHIGTLIATDIDLEPLVELTETPGLSVTGVVSGRLPVLISQTAVIINDANLTAQAPGVIRYTGAAQDALSSAGQNQATELAFGALREFNYEELSITLAGNVAGAMTLTVRANGSSPAAPSPFRNRPITLNVPITAAFAELLRNAATSLNVQSTIGEALNSEDR